MYVYMYIVHMAASSSRIGLFSLLAWLFSKKALTKALESRILAHSNGFVIYRACFTVSSALFVGKSASNSI